MREPRPLRNGVEWLRAFIRVTDLGLPRERPYVGQPWTFAGERGKQPLPPITLRDLADVIVQRLREAKDQGEWSWRRWDDNALATNVCRALEEEFPEHFRWLAEHPIGKVKDT